MGDFAGEGMTTGSDEVATAMISAISTVNGAIFGLQYDTQYFGSDGNIYDKVLKSKRFYSYNYTGPYNGKAFASDYRIENTAQVNYQTTEQYTTYSHSWFFVGDVSIANKVVKLISLHVDWQDKYRRQEQLRQVKAYADNFERVIIIGDFNPDDYVNEVLQSTNLTTPEDMAIFTSGGRYAHANAGYFGDFDTVVSPTPTYLWNGDNILVTTANMTINYANRYYDQTYMNDHAIFYADITIY